MTINKTVIVFENWRETIINLIIENDQKTCTKCNETFPATFDYFYKQKIKNKEGVIYKLTSYCKECHKKHARKWTVANRDKHNEAQIRYFHTEKGRKTRNPENDKQRLREWQLDNPERLKGYRDNRNQNKTHEISSEEWERCKNYFNYRCAYCDLKVEDHYIQHRGKTILGDFHREHLEHDGANDLSNCVPSCKSCNSSKHIYTLEEWYNEDNLRYSEERIHRINKWLNDDYRTLIDN